MVYFILPSVIFLLANNNFATNYTYKVRKPESITDERINHLVVKSLNQMWISNIMHQNLTSEVESNEKYIWMFFNIQFLGSFSGGEIINNISLRNPNKPDTSMLKNVVTYKLPKHAIMVFRYILDYKGYERIKNNTKEYNDFQSIFDNNELKSLHFCYKYPRILPSQGTLTLELHGYKESVTSKVLKLEFFYRKKIYVLEYSTVNLDPNSKNFGRMNTTPDSLEKKQIRIKSNVKNFYYFSLHTTENEMFRYTLLNLYIQNKDIAVRKSEQYSKLRFNMNKNPFKKPEPAASDKDKTKNRKFMRKIVSLVLVIFSIVAIVLAGTYYLVKRKGKRWNTKAAFI